MMKSADVIADVIANVTAEVTADEMLRQLVTQLSTCFSRTELVKPAMGGERGDRIKVTNMMEL